MTTWQVAVVKEQGVTFAVICVQDSVIDNSHERERVWQWWTTHLGMPAALLGGRRHRSYGRKDIVGWLENVDPSRLPWRQMSVAA
jgi:hypothetical protein